jgi:hypothetical protein
MTTMWGNTDVASNSVIWAPAKFNQAPTRANANLMYGNTSSGALITGQTIDLVQINDNEMNTTGVYRVTAASPNTVGSGYVPADVLTVANTGAGDGNTITAANLDVLTTQVGTIALNGVGTGGSYFAGEQLRVANGVSTVNAWANITSVELRTVAVVAGGTGYANGNIVQLASGTGTQANLTVTTGAADTIVASLALTTRGTYTVTPNVSAGAATTNATGSGTGLTITATTRIKALGAIATGNGGAFTTNPSTTGATTNTSLSTGTGATVDVTMGIGTLGVNNAGLYTKQTNVTAAALTGGSGSSATAVLTEPQAVPEAKYAGMTGWAVRTVGSGLRAGRVQYEVLVAGVGGDQANGTSDDPYLPQGT